MDLSKFGRGRYLASADIPAGGTIVTMIGGDQATFEDGDRAVLRTDLGDLVLNKTNLRAVEEITGQLTDSDAWNGFQCILRVERVAFSGRMVPAIRIYPVEEAPQTRPAPVEREPMQRRPASPSKPAAPIGGPLKPARKAAAPAQQHNSPIDDVDIPF